jgi:photosystem II stability/assembly factor-like uncharacterized protein
MKNAVLYISIALLLSNTTITYSQYWVDMFSSRKANFYETQKEFYKYWNGKTPKRGQGWMVFKRWEYDMEPRVYPSGKLPDPAAVYKEIKKYKQQQADKMSDLSEWSPMGPYNWLSISYNPGIGRINCIDGYPRSATALFAGSPSGGLWRSTNNGLNWFSASDKLEVLGITSVLINPSDPNIKYIATGDGDGGDCYSIGILKTTDGGMNWNTTGLSYQVTEGVRIYSLVMIPTNPNILLAATTSGVYRSTNGADTWTLVTNKFVRSIEFHPADPSRVYASGSHFYISTDTGITFNEISTGLPTSGVYRYVIGVSPNGPDYVYLLGCNSTDYGLYGFYRSTNGGLKFEQTFNSPNILGYEPDGSSTGGQSWYDLCIAVSPVNVNEVFTGGINVWKSTNAGNNFTCNTYWVWPPDQYGYVHADIHVLKFIGRTLFAGTDGGLFKSTNFGLNWIDISEGMSTTQFYRFGGTPQNPDFMIGGTQDNGTNLYDERVWTHVLGADGMEAAVNPARQSTVYCSIYNGYLCRSYNSGVNFTPIKNNITGEGGWLTPYILDPSKPSTIYAGYQDIWKSINEGNSWEKLSDLNGGTFVCIAMAKSNNSYIYANTMSSVYRTTDGGGTWTDITAGLPNNALTYLDVSSTNPQQLWVTLSGYVEGEKVYFSSDAGGNWSNISGSLPNIPANCITYLEPNRLFVGMDAGVYYRDNTMSDWEPFMNALPNVRVNELELNIPANKIRAATYGRGIWESPIPDIVGTITQNNIPKQFALYQNYPNPFNPSTVIGFDLAARTKVTLRIFNILGQEIRTLVNSELAAGHNTVSWDGRNNNGVPVNSGIYIYQIQAGSFRDAKKLAFVR